MNDPALVQDIEAASLAEMGNKLAFSKMLQAVANKIRGGESDNLCNHRG